MHLHTHTHTMARAGPGSDREPDTPPTSPTRAAGTRLRGPREQEAAIPSWRGESIPALRCGMRRLHHQANASPSSSRAHSPVALRPSPCGAVEHPMTISPWQPDSISCRWIGRFGRFLRHGVARGVPCCVVFPPRGGGDPCFLPFDGCVVLRPTVVSAGPNAGRRTFD